MKAKQFGLNNDDLIMLTNYMALMGGGMGLGGGRPQ